jgi:hypothetical protein
MGVHKYQVAAAADTLAPRDAIVNTLYFNHTLEPILPEDLDAVCGDLCDLFASTWYSASATRQIETTAYDLGAPPNPPVGHHIINVGSAPVSQGPREIALCLSFYADQNTPRKRGRIYLMVTGFHTPNAVRPDASEMSRALALAAGLRDIGGVNVDWSVHSTTDGTTRKVEHAWCDDEWDTVRKRGMKPTTRQSMSLSG